MNCVHKFLLACVPLAGLAACGGGDTADRFNVADPVVRFVHAAPLAPNLTLYNGAAAQSDATDTPYRFASNYFDIGMGQSDWSVKTAIGAAAVGTVSIDPKRGDKYTIVALPVSDTENGVYLIVDPYNKPLTSSSTRLQVMNAAFNASNIDLYMNAVGTDSAAAGVNPLIGATAYKVSGPVSGDDSIDIPGGTYQHTITAAGAKTVLFRGQISFANNLDILLLCVPASLLAGDIETLVKVEGTTGTTEVSPS
jgi:hypothetical protein